MNKLVIVESPTKAKTIAKFLGSGFRIESSYGHIRDLPKSKMGIKIEHNFQPEYVVPKQAAKRVATLKKLSNEVPAVILATDEDREGEAIAWHLVQALQLPESKTERIVFHEITKNAIEEAFQNPRKLDLHLVDAQQARRILDRLVGYELSPFLWKKVKAGLSAGRVQSVALRLVVEREREIEKFKAEEYWTIEARLKKESDPDTQAFTAKLYQSDRQVLKKFDLKTKEDADKIVQELKGAKYQVIDIRKKEVSRYPAAPFTTSTLQQEGARKLGLSAKQTMMLAQELYETGYITYMRTDSVNLAEQALHQARIVIQEKFGKDYALPSPRRYKTKSKGAQEAHEAIRPTDLSQDPDGLKTVLEKKQAKLYELIWKRTIGSQMPEAVFDQTTVDILASTDKERVFRATGQVVKFEGFLKVYTEGLDESSEPEELPEGQLPKLEKEEILNLLELQGRQHFTQPLPRYTDATLVKALEEYGIGRPSTYAPTISTILERGYVERIEKKFNPTKIGFLVNDLLVEHFPEIVDYQFTAHMEEELDEIAEGKIAWQPVVKEFYDPFKAHLEEKKQTVEKQVEKTDIPCPECGKPMVKKFGRYGQFLACSDYPKCKGTKPLPEEEAARKKIEKENSGKHCPLCGEGELVVRRGKFGHFLGCSRYPNCKYVERVEKKTGISCPECQQGELIEKRTRKGKIFWGCNRYPACEYASWQYPAAEKKSPE